MNESLAGEACSQESVVRQLADEFLRRQEAGERPDIEEYVARHPQAADLLRKVLASLQLLEASRTGQVLPLAGDADGQATGTLGDFRLIREVGRGGMGVVYEAEQISLGRRVALKVLPFAATLDPKQLQRFKNEAQAAAHLQHQHIVPVYFVGCERGVHFYAMQFVEGQTLAALIADLRRLSSPGVVDQTPAAPGLVGELTSGRWAPVRRGSAAGQATDPHAPSPADPGQATVRAGASSTAHSVRDPAYFRTVAALGVQGAEALAHAHQLGVIHRDIKPANLLVDGRGHLWVTDFGLAQFQQGGGLTMTGDLVGTLRYMSPEQALAHRVAVDHRTDVYSLGATLYELLALEPPFRGTDRQELLRQIAFEEPKAPRRLNPAIPVELETIVLKALAKNPDERYATAQELAEDLGRFLEDKPIRARRPTLFQRARKWARRHPAVVNSALVAGVLFLVGAVALLLVSNTAIRQEQAKTAAAEKELALSLYFETMARVGHERATGNVGLAEQLLEDSERCPAHLRGWEWHYLKRLRYGRPPAIPLVPQVQQVAVCPDGWRLAIPDFHAVRIWDAPRGRHLLDIPADGHEGIFVAFSPDGRRLAVPGQGATVVLWDTETWKPDRTLVPGGDDNATRKVAERVAWSPDGHYVAAGDDGGIIRLWDVGNGQPLPSVPAHAGALRSLAFSPDSQRLACTGETLQVWDVASGALVYRFEPPRTTLFQAVFSPDGKYLAVSTGDLYWEGDRGDVYLLDAATGSLVRPLGGHRGAVFSVAFHPDGTRLASACTEDKTIKLWDVATGKEALSLRGHVEGVQYVTFSPDGHRLYSVDMDRQLLTWDATPLDGEPPGAPRSLSGHTQRVSVVAFSPGGPYLASGGLDGKVMLRDARSGQLMLTLPHEGCVQCLAFTPDGRCLAVVSSAPKVGSWVKLWAVPSGKELWTHECRADCKPSLGLAFSPDGRWLAWPEEGLDDYSLVVSEAATGRPVQTFLGPAFWLSTTVAFHPNGRLLVTGHVDGNVSVFELTSGPDVAALCLALAGPNPGSALLPAWRLTTPVHGFQAHTGRLGQAVFSPDGKWLVTTGGADGLLKIWDVKTWASHELRAHPGGAYGVAFSRDGKRLATGGQDAVVRIWDWNEGHPTERLALSGHGDTVHSVAFDETGLRVASGGRDRVVKVWDLGTAFEAAGPHQPEDDNHGK